MASLVMTIDSDSDGATPVEDVAVKGKKDKKEKKAKK